MKADKKTCVHDYSKIRKNLLIMVQAMPDLRNLDTAMLNAAIDKALHETEDVFEDFQILVLDRVLWQFFAKKSGFWIGCRTPEGNAIPAEILVKAYTMWRNAMSFAENRGIDNMKAATALLKAVYVTVDDLSNGNSIADAQKYIFGVYRHNLSRITRKHGFDHGKIELTDENLADKGIYLEQIDNKILCRELLDAMPPQGKRVAVLRYKIGCSWMETAKKLGTSINAAQKALSIGLQRAFDAYMKDRPKAKQSGIRRRKKAKNSCIGS